MDDRKNLIGQARHSALGLATHSPKTKVVLYGEEVVALFAELDAVTAERDDALRIMDRDADRIASAIRERDEQKARAELAEARLLAERFERFNGLHPAFTPDPFVSEWRAPIHDFANLVIRRCVSGAGRVVWMRGRFEYATAYDALTDPRTLSNLGAAEAALASGGE